ncbi:probable disease resistance protein RF9 [Salvia hispanica]|uniref:probable disease resistance protein RF9 n=1 Tax=Salvia hispanica TaxID=49212 RepID=UPI0020094373|nr:probable disease resistance protein RF9 [Salvia hispanica]
MSEAVILGVIREVESDSEENQSIDSDYKMILLNELRMMLCLLRDKESGVLRCRLDHLVADFTEMTQLSTNPTTQRVIAYARDWLSKIENSMMEFGIDREHHLEEGRTEFVGLEIIGKEQNRLDCVAMWACLDLSTGKCMTDVVVEMIAKFVRQGAETKGYYRNMSEAIIAWAGEQLCSFWDSKSEGDHKSITDEIINELEQVVNFFNKSEPGELDMLNHLLADFAEMAQLSVNYTINSEEIFMKIELEMARDWLRKLRKRIMEFGGGEEANVPQSVGEEGVVVGLEKEVQLISRAILDESTRCKLIRIKGMLGSGKTTLARQVYNHPDIIQKFKHRAWISLSSDTSVNEVLVELLHKFGGPLYVEEMDNKSLQRWLHWHMQGMSHFIVLDNVPKNMRLESILSGLPEEGNGSTLMFTSRYVIENACIHYAHEMKALESDKSWQLFFRTINKIINDEKNKFSKELERKGKEMLKQCGGLPIAIIDVARQKANQRLLGMEWEEIFESIDLGRLLKLVEPMYHKLDTEVKPYFLHLSLFKENAIMREEKLKQIWIASGASSNMKTQMIENPCDSLAKDSIINVVKRGSLYCETRKYRLNPLLHMLSIEIAEKEIGLEVIRSNGNSRLSQNPRHRVIHCGREKFSHSTNQNGKHLISLIFHGGGGYLDNVCSSYWESFELLKVLDMEDFGVKTLSKTTGTMTNLRYLGLRNNYLTNIPHSLGGLEQLEVLDIAQNFMVEVPDIIWRIATLRYLYMSDVVCSEPLKIDLWKLTTVTYISIYDLVFEVLSVFTPSRLRFLGIEDIDENSNVSKLFASLTNMIMISLCLTLRGFRFRSMPCLDQIGILIYKLQKLKLDGCLARLPKTLCELRDAKELVLVNTRLGEDPMPAIEKMPFLQRLKLRNAYTGREMVIKDNGFPHLSVLNINELWNLRNIQVGEGAMPFLEKLELKNCPHLKKLPQEIGSMEYLRKFEMLTTRHIATKIKNSGLISKILDVDIGPLSSMA